MQEAPFHAGESCLHELPLSEGTAGTGDGQTKELLVREELGALVVVSAAALRTAEELGATLGPLPRDPDGPRASRIHAQEALERLDGRGPFARHDGDGRVVGGDGGVDALRHGRWMSFGRAGQTLSPSVGGARPVR